MISFKQYVAESTEDKGILKAIFLAGTPGSGKSYTVGKLTAGHIQPRIINTDKFIEFLAHRAGASLGKGGNVEAFLDKSQQLTKTQLAHYLNGMLPLFIDGTSSNINNLLMRSGVLESLGYDVGMIFVNTDIDTAIARAEKRERHVDPEFIRQVYATAQDNKEYYAGKFDFFIEVSNNDGELTDAAIQKAFRKTTSFFSGPIKNPIGKRAIEKLRKSGEKYLAPILITDAELNKKVDAWYRD